VLKWRQDNPKVAGELWTSLAAANRTIFESLRTLTSLSMVSPLVSSAFLADIIFLNS
jgi:hypothetical protein